MFEQGRPALASPRLPSLCRQLEAAPIEAGRNDAADQRPVAEAYGGLPGVGRHDPLRALPRSEIGAERHALDRAFVILRDLKHERRAGVVVPDLDCVDPVPVRAPAARQQEIGVNSSCPKALGQLTPSGARNLCYCPAVPRSASGWTAGQPAVASNAGQRANERMVISRSGVSPKCREQVSRMKCRA
jgi:hypothetical protein